MTGTERIFDWLNEHGPATKLTIAAELGLPRATVVNLLRGLARVGRVQNVASEKRTGAPGSPLSVWAVTQQFPNVIESALQSRTALEVAWR